MATIKSLMRRAEDALGEEGRDTNVPKVLFYHVSGMSPTELYMNMDAEVDPEVAQTFDDAFRRYLEGEPVQYIIGYEYFYAYDFKVNENVLIPRYETEELVENILYAIDDYFPDQEVIDAVDVGTGSGAIGITLKLEEPRLNMTATDISAEALEVAKDNAAHLGADVTFLQGDMLEPLLERGMTFDIFVSNPPYIPQDQDIEAVVKDNEPHVALFGGDDGLYFYRKIFAGVKPLLKDRALLAFEMGFDQRELMDAALAEYFPGVPYEIKKDMNGKDRMLMVYWGLK